MEEQLQTVQSKTLSWMQGDQIFFFLKKKLFKIWTMKKLWSRRTGCIWNSSKDDLLLQPWHSGSYSGGLASSHFGWSNQWKMLPVLYHKRRSPERSRSGSNKQCRRIVWSLGESYLFVLSTTHLFFFLSNFSFLDVSQLYARSDISVSSQNGG